jgi:hypothetical protein
MSVGWAKSPAEKHARRLKKKSARPSGVHREFMGQLHPTVALASALG